MPREVHHRGDRQLLLHHLKNTLRTFRGTKLNILPTLNFSETLEWTPGLRNTLAGSWVNRTRRAFKFHKRRSQTKELDWTEAHLSFAGGGPLERQEGKL